jgi:hypothetical protein
MIRSSLLVAALMALPAVAEAAPQKANLWIEAQPNTCAEHRDALAASVKLACDATGGRCAVATDREAANRALILHCGEDEWHIEGRELNTGARWSAELTGSVDDRLRAASLFAARFETGVDAPPPEPWPTEEPRETAPKRPVVVPLVLGVAGVALLATGTVILLAAPDRPANCEEFTGKCQQLPGETEEQFRKDREQAGGADAQPTLGLAVVGVGAALAAAGAAIHFLWPSTKSTSTAVLPYANPYGGGVAATASF